MKIQCNVCEGAEAKVLCCADEAALCWECDEKVHAANKLASKHQRVPLSASSSHMPKCDICQEAFGYFFCLEDRALLCRKCDLAIHTANAYVSGHQRFLLTGVKVGLEATDHGTSSNSLKTDSGEKVSDTKSSSVSRKVSQMPQSSEYNEMLPTEAGGFGDFPPAKVSYGGGSNSGNMSQWTIDEFFGVNDFSQNYNYMDGSSNSRADSGKLEGSDSPILRSNEEEMEYDDYMDRVPDSSWTVPQIPSPPTASGLNWPKNPRYSFDNALFVPDIGFTSMQHPQNSSNFSRPRNHH
ncbi:putative transcription factor interactor and regulator LIM family [Medicago truncatula]|uniref:B-box type zinc finger protein n=1 Tax=Medicago truncatula TaxID=3880 RepID=A0A072VAB5_MEDTR|nr:B-box zinc finger protein 22 [Medicago truncatula]KEH38556.1 B-box type zinc finger protein [Medicago truncatula]RHN74840.1 putative transcription factor interactor and regulator LIM family [Medicago truncatula]